MTHDRLTRSGSSGAATAPKVPWRIATATPTPTPNPNALKFELDTTLDGSFNFTSAEQAGGHPFASAVFATDGVTSVFGVNDFVSVNRADDTVDWDPIIAAVQAAASTHL